jgi:CAAX protease family protein
MGRIGQKRNEIVYQSHGRWSTDTANTPLGPNELPLIHLRPVPNSPQIVYIGRMIEDELPAPHNLAKIAMLFEGGLGVLALVVGWALDRPLGELIDWTVTGALWGAAAALPPIVLLLVCVRIPVWPFSDVAEVIDRMLTPMFRDIGLVNLAMISALAGLGEELLFRGLLQQGLANWIGGPAGVWIALAAASIIFGLVHPVTPTYAVLATLMGAYLGWLWIDTENLLVPIAAHGVYDFLTLTYIVKIRGQRREPSRNEPADEEEVNLTGREKDG